MRPSRSGLLLVSTAIAALTLTGCASGGVLSPIPQETRTSEELQADYSENLRLESLITPDVAPPSDPTLTAPATSLVLGQWAVLPDTLVTSDLDEAWSVAVRPVELREGDLAVDFAEFSQSDRDALGDVTPVYVDVQFSHVAGDDMRSSMDHEIKLILSDGSEAGKTLISGLSTSANSTPFCVTSPGVGDITEEPGDVFGGCSIFLVPAGLEPATLQWSNLEEYNDEGRVSWSL
jgi:hypothetical protein